MSFIQRNKSNQSPDSEKRSNASNANNASNAVIAASLAHIPVAAPFEMRNRYSALKDESSDIDSTDDLTNFEWKDLDDENNVNNMEDDVDNDNVVEESSDTSEESVTSDEEIVINHRRYQRITQPWCRDGVPCAVTSIITLLSFAYFMQFVFYMCGVVGDDCSKGRR